MRDAAFALRTLSASPPRRMLLKPQRSSTPRDSPFRIEALMQTSFDRHPLSRTHRCCPWRLLPAIGALMWLVACSHPDEDKAEAPPVVQGVTVSFPDQQAPKDLRVETVGAEFEHALDVPGRLGWDEDHTARVYAPYAGRVERVRVALGEVVSKGQALADVSSSDIGQAQADLHKAQADQSVTRAAVERARELAHAGVIAQKDLQQSEADLARNAAEVGRANARLVQYGIASNSVTQGLVIASPLNGIVVERNINGKGEVRSDVQGQPLFTISDSSSLWASLDVDETQLGAFHVGQSIQLQAAAWPERSFPAVVTSISESVDPNSRTVKVRVKVPNVERLLKAEMFVTARAIQRHSGPTIAADAVLLSGDRLFVFVQSGAGHFERREIKARSAGPQTWLVSQGVAPGDRIVVGGALYLEQLFDAAR